MMNENFIRRSKKRVRCKIIGDFISCHYEMPEFIQTIIVLFSPPKKGNTLQLLQKKKGNKN